MVSSIDELVRTATALDDTKSALLWQSILQVVIQRVAANAYVARDLRLVTSVGYNGMVEGTTMQAHVDWKKATKVARWRAMDANRHAHWHMTPT